MVIKDVTTATNINVIGGTIPGTNSIEQDDIDNGESVAAEEEGGREDGDEGVHQLGYCISDLCLD